jgi:cyclopropane fatty-acyl-phospholipid synthase-like methyltransferase
MALKLDDLRSKLVSRTKHGVAPNSGVPLPPVAYRMGGEHFKDDAAFIERGVADVEHLVGRCGLGANSSLLDWGCGAGRLAVGVAERFGSIGLYHGVDVQKSLITWADRNIGRRPGFRFTWVDLANERYNPQGRPDRSIPAETGAYDILYAYSVLSHMLSEDLAGYLAEFRRVLKPGGTAWFTAFVEANVPDETENPVGYGPLKWDGRLHCVRFSRGYFEAIMQKAGLTISDFEQGRETDGQSSYLVRVGP